jgi:hypothetical protein
LLSCAGVERVGFFFSFFLFLGGLFLKHSFIIFFPTFLFSVFLPFGALAFRFFCFFSSGKKRKTKTRGMSKPGGRSALTAALTGTGGEGAEAAPASASAAGSHVRLDAAAFPCLASVLGKSSKPVLAGAAAAAAASAASDTVGELSSGFERVKLRGNDVLAGSAPTAHLLPDGSAAVSGREKWKRWKIGLGFRQSPLFFSPFGAFSLASLCSFLGHALSTSSHASPKRLLPRRGVVTLSARGGGEIESC